MEMRSTYYGKKTQSFIKVPQKHDISMLFNYIPGPMMLIQEYVLLG